jgi:GMP synthase-like glutamine amidotransferase
MTPPLLKSALASNDANKLPRALKLALLSIEKNEPYCCFDSTSQSVGIISKQLFNLLVRALDAIPTNPYTELKVTVFDSMGASEYPSDFDSFDGFLLPGSLHSAYEEKVDWIESLKTQIQVNLAGQTKRKLIGICFGHQIMAHSLGGLACTNSQGPNICETAPLAVSSLGRSVLHLNGDDEDEKNKILCCHSDIVSKLPSNARKLAGSDSVEFGIVGYWGTEEEAKEAERSSDSADISPLPFAITVQGHPEFLGSEGRTTMVEIAEGYLVKSGAVPKSEAADKCLAMDIETTDTFGVRLLTGIMRTLFID